MKIFVGLLISAALVAAVFIVRGAFSSGTVEASADAGVTQEELDRRENDRRAERLAAMTHANKTLLVQKSDLQKNLASIEFQNQNDEAEFAKLLGEYNDAIADLEELDKTVTKNKARIKSLASTIDVATVKLNNAKNEVLGTNARVKQLEYNMGPRSQFASTYNHAIEDNNRAARHLAEATAYYTEKATIRDSTEKENESLKNERVKIVSDIDRLKSHGKNVKERMTLRAPTLAAAKAGLQEIDNKLAK